MLVLAVAEEARSEVAVRALVLRWVLFARKLLVDSIVLATTLEAGSLIVGKLMLERYSMTRWWRD